MAIYTDRVDPLIKIVHLPTFWVDLTTALQSEQEMSESFEALVFAFYLITIQSLTETESWDLLGEQNEVLSTRYRNAARQALINAQLLNTSSLSTLQAFAIFIVSGNARAYHSDNAKMHRWE